MLIGYTLNVTDDAESKTQYQSLLDIGCQDYYVESAGAGRWNRPELNKMMRKLKTGDVVVVGKLTCLTRSIKDVMFILEQIHSKGAFFRSLSEQIDTRTEAGIMFMRMITTFTDYERSMLKERTRHGIDDSRAVGRTGGRKHKLSDRQQQEAIELVNSGKKTAADVARLFDVNPATISRLIARFHHNK